MEEKGNQGAEAACGLGGCCDEAAAGLPPHGPYRNVLWIALVANMAMFAVEILYGLRAGSMSLLADAADFMADSATYGVTLFVLGRPPHWRASAALLKGALMGGFGLWVLVMTALRFVEPGLPHAPVMGIVGGLALAANVSVAALLFRYRTGDANVRAVWLCSRNDALANIGILVAAGGVAATGTAWPDLAIGAGITLLCLHGAASVIRQAVAELGRERDEGVHAPAERSPAE